MLTTALGANPYCASKLLVVTRNSSVASVFGKGAASRLKVSMLATPSRRYQVLPWRWPPAEAPDSVEKELLLVGVGASECSSFGVHGARATSAEGSRPSMGNSVTSSWLMT